MKSFVVFSDLHLHQWQYGSTIVNGRNSRLEQQKEVVKSIVRYCSDRDISEVVFCGDLYHTSNISAEVSQAAYEAFSGFKKAKINLTIIVGNHDQSSRSGETHALGFFRELGRLVEFGAGRDHEDVHQRDIRIHGIHANLLPFTDERAQLERWLSKTRGGFIFMHQGVGGVEVNSKGFTLNEILTPDMVPDSCAMAFTGHYHSHRAVTSNLIIPGSTVQLNWGDQNETRGWLDVKIEGDKVHEIELVPSNASQFVTISEEDVESMVGSVPGNFIRVLSKGGYSPDELTAYLMGNGAASVEIKQAVVAQPVSKIEAKSLLSFTDMVMSYATAKEHAGVINAYDKEVGEALLKGNYQPPSV